jgi:hypothetical protein
MLIGFVGHRLVLWGRISIAVPVKTQNLPLAVSQFCIIIRLSMF